MAYKYIDLFCGAGGLSLGFDSAKFENVFAVEFNSDFAKTYMRNFPKHNLIIDDIRNIDNDKIKGLVGNNEVDVIIGGPPCQGFSIAGNIGRTFIDDERNRLFKEFVRFVTCVQPKMFVMENVAAMATHLKGKTIKTIVDAFENAGCGYKVKYEVLNSANYGIAQERRRIVVVGIRSDIDSEFFYPSKSEKTYTIKDVIGDLPKLESGQESISPNLVAMMHSAQMIEKMCYV